MSSRVGLPLRLTQPRPWKTAGTRGRLADGTFRRLDGAPVSPVGRASKSHGHKHSKKAIHCQAEVRHGSDKLLCSKGTCFNIERCCSAPRYERFLPRLRLLASLKVATERTAWDGERTLVPFWIPTYTCRNAGLELDRSVGDGTCHSVSPSVRQFWTAAGRSSLW